MKGADLFTLPIVNGVAVSPDGKRAAYAALTADLNEDRYRSAIRIVGLGGGNARPLTRGVARDAQPRWSPDGERLLFLSDREDRRQVWIVDVAGGEPEPAPEVPGNVSAASFSPDGRMIAAVAVDDVNRKEILARGWRRIDRLRYRADGFGYLDDDPRIWLIDLAAGTARRLPHAAGHVGAPAWSPDGAEMAYAAEHRRDADSLWHTELWRAPTRGDGAPRRIAGLRGAIECPAWSPDGTRIAFAGHDDPAYSLGSLRLYEVGADGNGLRCVNPDGPYCGNATLNDLEASAAVAPPVWLDDGWLALGTDRGVTGVFHVTSDGGARRVTPAEHGVTEFSTAGRTLVVCASTSSTPPELHACDVSGANLRRLTHDTAAWCAGRRLRAAERFAVTGPGGPIDAWRMRAADGPAPDERRPCVLQIHGGPHFAYGETFFFEFQLLADAGFDVVFCNPRGSQGYGDAFLRSIVDDWAAPAFDDCMAALDTAIAAGGIDAQRLGVAGGSYGGYLTTWSIGHTRRFKAAVAMRPATNLATLWGTSEVGRMLDDELSSTPASDPERYRLQSPLTFAADIATPLLLIHAEHDARCPVEQSEQLFAALKQRGACVEFLRFTEGDHGLARAGPPRLRAAHHDAIVDWFARHAT